MKITAPMIKECPLCMECKVSEIIDLPSNLLVLGEMIAGHTEERFLKESKTDIKKMNPFLLTMPGNKYLLVGEDLAKAWDAGRKLKQGG